MHFLTTCLLLGTVSTTAIAQDQPNTILVIDGSGSMWGQIDGAAKITIAQEVVGDLLADFPADQGLGLTVYGHRERGNCTDIETIVAPASGTVDDVIAAVNEITPLGKTPMTDAVIAAAEALRYTEEEATVILVSDGVETCNPDPCTAARLLEEAGIGFTAHVVGFDVSDPEALAQMQCLAEETGGQFLTASNADELDLAMTAMVMEPAPEPALVSMTFTAVIGENKALIDTPILWDINDGSGLIVEDAQANPLTYDLPEGAYTATAYSIAGEETGEAQFVAITGGATAVEVLFEQKQPTARVIAPTSAPAGGTIQVGWAGPALEGDYVGIGKPDATGSAQWDNFFYVADGNPNDLLMPTEPGDYLIRYFIGGDRAIIAETPISLTPVIATIDAPAEAIAGNDITVSWTGPAYDGDYIGIGAVDATGSAQWDNFFYLDEGSPQTLTVPTQVGQYTISYFVGQDRSVLATVPLTATEASATLNIPAEAIAGSTISVDWTGPAYDGDYIGIGAVDATGSAQWDNFFYVQDGTPNDLLVPTQPGEYLVQYFLGQDRAILVSDTLTATPVKVDITAPDTAVAGSTITVGFDGPGYDGDYIGIGMVNATGSAQWEGFSYTDEGTPVDILVPVTPGDYLIQYFAGQDRSVLQTLPITVTAIEARLIAPDSAAAGSDLIVGWDGPDYEGDYIGIGLADAENSARWDSFAYTRDGNPLSINLPDAAGDYIIRYFVGQDRTVIASRPLTIDE
ncbi:Ca-activated chloride channel family protein [Yoonia maricola]|uniref:Ca-activated chloride channel family protein n=1 Tax=Yoonia maricola TaxID=420999 RepID=A0A2M8WKW0_9RHOB|nr:VWA domain-containing protein [Yoonia maricola]PJI91557.1 Ca-activated chloride channel family protein [Yoonia maricola]